MTALERGLRLLMALRYGDGARLSDLARRTELDKATASRLLRSLTRYAFATKGADDLYRLGPALAVLARGTPEQTISTIVGPPLRRLADATGETASFFVPQGDFRLCVAAYAGRYPVSHVLKVGDALPTDRGAGGRVLRMYAKRLMPCGDAEVQISLGERDPELAAVAAPIFDGRGGLLGAISLSGTCTRFRSDEYLETLRARLAATANELNRIFGGAGSAPTATALLEPAEAVAQRDRVKRASGT